MLGQGKGVLGAFISVLIFRNTVTSQGCLGYAITVAGVLGYSWSKQRGAEALAAAKNRSGAGAGADAKDVEAAQPLLAPAAGEGSPAGGCRGREGETGADMIISSIHLRHLQL